MQLMKDTKFAKSSSSGRRMKVFKYLIWLASTGAHTDDSNILFMRSNLPNLSPLPP